MSGRSIGTYTGGTAFVGLGSFLAPFDISVGVPTLQQASITSVAIGAGFGIYATYAGFFDGHVRVPKKIAQAGVYNATAVEVYEDVGVHWLDFPAGYFPLNIPAHVDDGNQSLLLSAFDSGHGECAVDEVVTSVKWMDYPAGYFPLNIPAFVDNGEESVLKSAFHPEPTVCALDEAPVPVKWLEYATEFVPNAMDLLVDDDVPFGFTTDMVCPADSEPIERAFFTLRNPPTRTLMESTPVHFTIDTRPGFIYPLVIALIIAFFTMLGAMSFAFKSRYSTLNAEVLNNEAPVQQIDQKLVELAKKKALEAALYKLGATPASRVAGCRHRTKKKPKKANKTNENQKFTTHAHDVEKHSFSIARAPESLD